MAARLGRVAILLCLVLVASTGARALSLNDTADLEAFFDGVFAIQQLQYNVPGIAVAVVKDGEVLLAKGYGYADLANKEPVDPVRTLHRAASNTKVLVWTAVMQLVEAGKLDLHKDVNEYLDFKIPAQLHSGVQAPPITLHHLLTHTAGFEDVLTETFVLDKGDLRPLGEYLQVRMPARVALPGTMLAYSNYGSALAGYIVERASGQPFYEYVEEHIFAPLDMTNSTLRQPLPDNLAPYMSKGYHWSRGRHIAGDFEYAQAYPAGSLTTTALDMAKLMIAHLQLGAYGENRVLAEETAQLMQSQQYTNHPELPGMAYGFIENYVNSYRILEQGGDTGLFHSGLFLIPEEHVGLYVVYNMMNTSGARIELFEAFMNRYFPAQTETQVTPKPIPLGAAPNYVGTYHSTRSNFTMPESIARLVMAYQVDVDDEGYLTISTKGSTSRYGEIAPGLFQKLDSPDKIALAFRDGKVAAIHRAGPHSLIRAPWYLAMPIVVSALLAAIAFMLFTLVVWAVQLVKGSRRKQRFGLPKLVGTLFILGFFSQVVILLRAALDIHPDFQTPRMFLQQSGPLDTLTSMSRVLGGLASIMAVLTLYAWFKRLGTGWMRLHYTCLTLCSVAVTWLMWNFNFL